MISISRYLREGGNGTAGIIPAGSSVISGLCVSILDYIGLYVFTGEFSQFREQLQEPKNALRAEPEETEARQIEESVRTILSGYNRIAQETLQNSAIEMQQMVGVLGHALTVLSSGSDRSVSRLQRIQETLLRTSTIQDISALRASLRDAVQLVGEESSKERVAGVREREGIETQVVRFRELLAGNPNRRLQGRSEAIRAIGDSVASHPTERKVWVLVFVLEQLKAIVQRYGPEAVDDLFLQLIRERLQSVAPVNTAFRWSTSGIVGIAQIERDLAGLQNDMARLNRAPLVCRVSLGSRTAVLKVGLSYLVVEATAQSMEQITGEIDRFTGFVEGA